ncbi:MAG TPA: zf-HC2 domain-containing protein [Vicinamibacteria bacterium]|nr:zf-HC2 domain-containing protein [Vicinamibacteria bacterium]
MTEHLSFDRLADYLAGLLEESASDEVEEHLFSCPSCASESEQVSGLAAAIRNAVPPILSLERYEALSREGKIFAVNPMSPGEVAESRFPPEGKLLVHRLGGSDLSPAHRVDVAIFDSQGVDLARFEDVPFDAARGEVLIACQRHFAALYPNDIVFRVEAILGDDRGEEKRYTVWHRE